jgi:L-ascorbate metabolism protein UlaG (beta-lactamase superfamily)
MKITKFVHSCLLVEDEGRVALFDPGAMSTGMIDLDNLTQLDDIFITHEHGDHQDPGFLKKAIAKFPTVRITTTDQVVQQLAAEGIKATTGAPAGVEFFDSPHEKVEPLFPTPQQIGIHYLNKLSHPGDSHHFKQAKPILALPITAPWGSTVYALNLALELKPQHVIPIHDWHWRDEARQGTYANFEKILGGQGITFHSTVDGEAFEIVT